MKTTPALTLIFIFLTSLCCAQSANYHTIKVDIGVGFDPISSTNSVSFTVEPHYRLSDELALGLRLQNDASGSFNFKSEGSSNVDTKFFTSTTASADYYFLKGKTPGSLVLFGGGGIGVFTESVTHNKVEMSNDNLGFFPRIGLETGHFRSSIEYNITGGSMSYLSINIGFFFGGGIK